MERLNVESDEKFGTHKSHQQSYREQEALDLCATREPFSTPLKPNKFVYAYSGILSATEQVNGSFRRFHGSGEKFNENKRPSVTPSKQYYDTPNFALSNDRDLAADKLYQQKVRQGNTQKWENTLQERLYAKANLISSPYERLLAPLRISSTKSSSMDSHEGPGK